MPINFYNCVTIFVEPVDEPKTWCEHMAASHCCPRKNRKHYGFAKKMNEESEELDNFLKSFKVYPKKCCGTTTFS